MVNDNMKLTGKLNIRVTGEDGTTKTDTTINNLVVTAGQEWVADLMQAGTGTPMSHMAVGTGTNAAAAGDTALQTEAARVALSVAGGTRTGASIEFVGVYPAGTGTGSLTEAGIFNATPAGTMLARTVFTAIAKGASDSLTITWTVSVG
jgi:hypothetical protein